LASTPYIFSQLEGAGPAYRFKDWIFHLSRSNKQ
jgi:hypothetical protein